MSRKIPEEIVERVRDESDIVSVISDYVRLQKKGRNYSGLCPFHSEKTPSFTVTPEKQMFYCFGCGVGGDVFKFLMLSENISYPEAIIRMAGKLGIPIPELHDDPENNKRKQQLQSFYKINRIAADYYHQLLLKTKMAETANRYLAERQVDRDSIEKFCLGFGGNNWDDLLTFMEKYGVSKQLMLQLGLISEGRNNRYYDRFRERIIFPVFDINGEVVAFGGRVMDNSQPKYLNSPETPVFSKSRNLFAINLAKQSIRQQNCAVLAEGYLDVISLHQYGITNAVASLGTALTKEQIRLLMRYTQHIIIAYDSDEAGIRAALRAIDLILEQGCKARVLTVTGGKDPDEFLKKNGAEAFRLLMEQAQDALEFKTDKLWEQGQHDAEQKLDVLHQVLSNIVQLNSELKQHEALQRIALKLGINWETAEGELKRYQQRRNKAYSNHSGQEQHTDKIDPDIMRDDHRFRPRNARQKAELLVIRILIEDHSYLDQVIQELGSRPFIDRLFQFVFDYLKTLNGDSKNFAGIFDLCDEQLQSEISKLSVFNIDFEQEIQLLPEYINAIKADNNRLRREDLLQKIAEAESKHDKTKVNDLLNELARLF